MFGLCVFVPTAVVQVDGNPVRLQLCDTAGQVSRTHTHIIPNVPREGSYTNIAMLMYHVTPGSDKRLPAFQ